MAKKVKDLLQRMGEITKEMRDLVEKADEEKRARTGEEEATLKRHNDELDQIEKDVETYKKLEEREAFLAQPQTAAIKTGMTRGASDDEQQADRMKLAEVFEKRYGERGRAIFSQIEGNPTATREYREAFRHYMTASPRNPLAVAEYRTLQAGDAAGGGYTVPQEEFLAELLKTADNQAVIRGIARSFQVPKAQSLGVPTLAADPADPTWTSELLVGAEDTTMAFGRREFHPQPLAQYIKVSDKLLRATPLGMESIVRDRLAYKVSTVLSSAMNIGDGVNKPLGAYTPSANGISTARDVDISTSNAIDPDKLITARFTLRQGYAPNAKWHLHRLFLAKIRSLKFTNGDYLWKPGLTEAAGNTLLDFPYVLDEYAPSTLTGTGVYIAILGDWNYYWVVDALDVRLQRLDELFALTNSVGFIIRMETDAQPVLEDAFVRCKGTLT